MLARLSIRARLAAAFVAALALVLALAAVFVYLRTESQLTEAIDDRLETRFADAELGGDAGGFVLRFDTDDDEFTQILSAGGTVLESTLGDGTAVIGGDRLERAAAGRTTIEGVEVAGIDGEARILAGPADDGEVVVTGVSTEDRDEALAEIATAFAIGAPVALLLAAGLGYLLATRALAPVDDIRRRAAEITLARRGERLDPPPADDELRALATTLNGMLDRIEASLEREREFVADASHELRTPLAILRAELELATRPDRTSEELRAALASAAEEVERLTRLADDLLVLARADEDGLPIRRERVELGELVDRVVARSSARAQEAGRGVVVEVPAGLVAEIDPLRVEQALGNLVDNALRHGSGRVGVRADGGDGGAVTFSVSDEGAGFPPEFAAAAFERFSRADRGAEGAGLGLAIVSAIAEAHGGRAWIDATAAGPAVRIELPPA